MQHRRTGGLLGVAVLLTLTACGSGSDSTAVPAAGDALVPTSGDVATADSTQDAAPAADAAPAGESEAAASTDAPAADSTDTSTDASTDTDAEQPVATDASEDASVGEEAPAEPVATEAPEAAPTEPVVGGRLFASDVQPAAQFDGNPFPDLVVDDIGKDAQVNIKNILPSDRPVLLWAWAPH
ncbi:MAG: hypothetical protein WA964_13495 [Ilumatobacter sp.]|uniref:hypothetical protein n=1 Tax=Ilumatobacter sp. TaxID=1967498 RepID=UPI003C750151